MLGLSTDVFDSSHPLFQLVLQTIQTSFSKALSNPELIQLLRTNLTKYQLNATNTLVATSFCADEVNRPLEHALEHLYDDHTRLDLSFQLGGLAGFPFAGKTGWKAMHSHLPDDTVGHAVIVYGPHVGISETGAVGVVNRKGQHLHTSACCGSAVAAGKAIENIATNVSSIPLAPDSVDVEQTLVTSSLLPYKERLASARDPMVELPYCTFEPIDQMMTQIVQGTGGKGVGGKLVLLGVSIYYFQLASAMGF